MLIDKQTFEDVSREVCEVLLASALLLALAICVGITSDGHLLASGSLSSWLGVLVLIDRGVSGVSSGRIGTISSGSQSVVDGITVDTAGRDIGIDLSVIINLGLCIRLLLRFSLRVCNGTLGLRVGALLCNLGRHFECVTGAEVGVVSQNTWRKNVIGR